MIIDIVLGAPFGLALVYIITGVDLVERASKGRWRIR